MDVLIPSTKTKTRCFHAFSTGWTCACILFPLILFELVFFGINVWGLVLFESIKDKGVSDKETPDGYCHMLKMVKSEIVVSIVLVAVLSTFVIFMMCMCVVQTGYYCSTLIPKCPTMAGARQALLIGPQILICVVCVFISLQLFVLGLITLIHYKESDYIQLHSTASIFTKYTFVEHEVCSKAYPSETKSINAHLNVKTILYNVFFYLFIVGEIVGVLLIWVGPFLFILLGIIRNKKKKYKPLTDEEDFDDD